MTNGDKIRYRGHECTIVQRSVKHPGSIVIEYRDGWTMRQNDSETEGLYPDKLYHYIPMPIDYTDSIIEQEYQIF